MGTGPARATAARGWRELVADFGAAFVCDEMGVEGVPVASPISYIALWRDDGRLSDTEVLEADVRARAFVIRAEALGKMNPGEDPDAWEREAMSLLTMAAQIDLTIPEDEAAIAAAVAYETPASATPVTAAAWLRDFQERTMRIRAARQPTRSAGTRTENDSLTRSNHVKRMPSFLSGRRPQPPGGRASAAAERKSESPPIRGHGCFRVDWVFLVETVDATQPDDAAIMGLMRPPHQLADIDVGTVLFHCPVDPVIPPAERPWQAGRVHLDGVRWEEKTWRRTDFPAFRDRVASLMAFTVPGDKRLQSHSLPVVGNASSAGSDLS